MSRLLSAGFSRLFKSKLFYAEIILMMGIGAFMIVMRYIDVKNNPQIYGDMGIDFVSGDRFLFMGASAAIFASAVFTGSFVGTEHSDGGFRNRIIIGCTRVSVYLSNVIVCSFAAIAMNLAHTLLVLVLKSFLFKVSEVTISELLIFCLCGSLFFIALTAIFVFAATLIPNKSAGSVSVIFIAMILFFASMGLTTKLYPIELLPVYSLDENGEKVPIKVFDNPNYISGTEREIYQTIYYLLPTCQINDVIEQNSDHLGIMSVYAAGEIIVISAIGIYVFCKKDIR